MNWNRFEKKYDLNDFWYSGEELMHRFLENKLTRYYFTESGHDLIGFNEIEYCYDKIFNHFIGDNK